MEECSSSSTVDGTPSIVETHCDTSTANIGALNDLTEDASAITTKDAVDNYYVKEDEQQPMPSIGDIPIPTNDLPSTSKQPLPHTTSELVAVNENSETQDGNQEETKEKEGLSPPASSLEAAPNSSEPEKLDGNKQQQDKPANNAKEKDKLTIYKKFATSLKRELQKTRDELRTLHDTSELKANNLNEKIAQLEKSLNSEQNISETLRISYEAQIQDLKRRLEGADQDLEALQAEYDCYKATAAKMMQENGLDKLQAKEQSFKEDRCKQLKDVISEQKKQIWAMEQKLSKAVLMNQTIEKQNKQMQQRIEQLNEQLKKKVDYEEKCKNLCIENENLKAALQQLRQFRVPKICADDDEKNNDETKSETNGYAPDIANSNCSGTNPLDSSEHMQSSIQTEYLKNIVFKFLALEEQLEQRRRLIPVLSTVLRLSPEETATLTQSVTKTVEYGITGSLFKLPLFNP